MSNPTHLLLQPPIRVVFSPYNHDSVQQLLRAINLDFGRRGTRWTYTSVAEETTEHNVWKLDFYFADQRDAVIFGLKYVR